MDNSEMCHIERAGWKTQLMLFPVERNEREREKEREREREERESKIYHWWAGLGPRTLDSWFLSRGCTTK